MKKIFRDGISYTLDSNSKILVRQTSDGHTIESWKSGGKRVYFANLANSVYCAHGESAAEAIGAAIWKDPKRRPSMEELVAKIRSQLDTYKISLGEFRALTGACEEGCKQFLNQHNLKSTVTMTLKEFMPIGGDWAKKLEDVLTRE